MNLGNFSVSLAVKDIAAGEELFLGYIPALYHTFAE